MKGVCILAVAALARGQERPEFDVVSIKPAAPSPNGSGGLSRSPGRVSCTYVSLQDLVEYAYSLKDFQISGPPFLDDVYFDVEARFPGETDDKRLSLMLQAMLEKRFKLAFHRETKTVNAFVLTAAKGGVKLKPVPEGEQRGFRTTRGGVGVHFTGKTDLAGFAEALSNVVDRPVVDMTGVAGVYEIDLEWAMDAGPDGPPALVTALQEKLGLRLESRKAPVDFYMIDHIERQASEN